MDENKLRLDIGAGGAPYDPERYKTVDSHADADYKADMWDLPFEDNSVDEIYSSHALEHVPMSKVPDTLKEWLRVLKPGARVIIIVPNFDYIAKYWLIGADRAWAEQMIFGNQMHDGEYHKCAFTNLMLRGDCESAGFNVERVEMRWDHDQETLQAVCRKPE